MVDENLEQIGLANKLIDYVVVDFSAPGGINDAHLFQEVLQQSIRLSQPVKIGGLIGQGGKNHLGKSDIDLLNKYSELSERVRQFYSPGAEIHLIGGDLHGLANGIENRGYLALMQERAQNLGLYWVMLSTLYNEKGITLPSKEKVTAKTQDGADREFHDWQYEVPAEIRLNLIQAARRHNIVGQDEYLDAFYYFVMRRQEERVFVPDWTNHLFVINSSKDLAAWTFPKLIPQMYWYQTRHHGGKGSRDLNKELILSPPWFRND
ncbi:hypothetical protein HY041_04205 [Candidatus Roizmanbacteria bacterium]|nr:hypothetical protein [Candidatus Roizmanbacteria bacterium]